MSMLDEVARLLAGLQLQFDRLDETHITISFDAPHVGYRVIVNVDPPIISFTAPRIIGVPEARLPEMLRLINLVNATRIRLGNFSVGPDLRLAFEVALIAVDAPSLDNVGLAIAALSAINTFYPAVALVLWAGATAEDALASLSAPAERQQPETERWDDLDETI